MDQLYTGSTLGKGFLILGPGPTCVGKDFALGHLGNLLKADGIPVRQIQTGTCFRALSYAIHAQGLAGYVGALPAGHQEILGLTMSLVHQRSWTVEQDGRVALSYGNYGSKVFLDDPVLTKGFIASTIPQFSGIQEVRDGLFGETGIIGTLIREGMENNEAVIVNTRGVTGEIPYNLLDNAYGKGRLLIARIEAASSEAWRALCVFRAMAYYNTNAPTDKQVEEIFSQVQKRTERDEANGVTMDPTWAERYRRAYSILLNNPSEGVDGLIAKLQPYRSLVSAVMRSQEKVEV